MAVTLCIKTDELEVSVGNGLSVLEYTSCPAFFGTSCEFVVVMFGVKSSLVDKILSAQQESLLVDPERF